MVARLICEGRMLVVKDGLLYQTCIERLNTCFFYNHIYGYLLFAD